MEALFSGVLYFGCWNDVGHFLYREGGTRISYNQSPIDVKYLDAEYVPGGAKGDLPEGIVRLTKLDGATVLGFRDSSIDSRGGSHSTFLIPGDVEYEEALDRAADAFPFVFQRLAARGITLQREAIRA